MIEEDAFWHEVGRVNRRQTARMYLLRGHIGTNNTAACWFDFLHRLSLALVLRRQRRPSSARAKTRPQLLCISLRSSHDLLRLLGKRRPERLVSHL